MFCTDHAKRKWYSMKRTRQIPPGLSHQSKHTQTEQSNQNTEIVCIKCIIAIFNQSSQSIYTVLLTTKQIQNTVKQRYSNK